MKTIRYLLSLPFEALGWVFGLATAAFMGAAEVIEGKRPVKMPDDVYG